MTWSRRVSRAAIVRVGECPDVVTAGPCGFVEQLFAADLAQAERDQRVRQLFEASKRTYGSPRIHADLRGEGWKVSVNTVADSMRRQGLQGRKPKRRRGLTK